MTVSANPVLHTFMEIGWIVMDTAWYALGAPGSRQTGPRWQPASHDRRADSLGQSYSPFVDRHPPGL